MSSDCDVCPQPATVARPATRNREPAQYCDYDASKLLGWGDTFHRITEEEPTVTLDPRYPQGIPGPDVGWGTMLSCKHRIEAFDDAGKPRKRPQVGKYIQCTERRCQTERLITGCWPENPPQMVAPTATGPVVLPSTRGRKPTREVTMARGRTAVAEETAATETDYTVYATKDLTAKQLDFAEWLSDNVGDIEKMDAARVAALGPLCYHAFQASDFNKERTESRRAEKASAVPAANIEKPAAATAKPRGRAATTSTVSTSKPAAPKAPRGRGRAAAATAPF